MWIPNRAPGPAQPARAIPIKGDNIMAATDVLPQQSPLASAPARPAKAPQKKKRWPKVLLILAILAALIFFFLIRPMMTATQQITNAMYSAVQAERRDITVSVSGTATVQPNDSYQVTSAVRSEILDAPLRRATPWRRAICCTPRQRGGGKRRPAGQDHCGTGPAQL